MKKLYYTIYRTVITNVSFMENELPEIMGFDAKAEWMSRSIPADDWKLEDVSVDLVSWEEVE